MLFLLLDFDNFDFVAVFGFLADFVYFGLSISDSFSLVESKFNFSMLSLSFFVLVDFVDLFLVNLFDDLVEAAIFFDMAISSSKTNSKMAYSSSVMSRLMVSAIEQEFDLGLGLHFSGTLLSKVNDFDLFRFDLGRESRDLSWTVSDDGTNVETSSSCFCVSFTGVLETLGTLLKLLTGDKILSLVSAAK